MTKFEMAYRELRALLDRMFEGYDCSIHIDIVDTADSHFLFDAEIEWMTGSSELRFFVDSNQDSPFKMEIRTPSESWETIIDESTIWKILYFKEL